MLDTFAIWLSLFKYQIYRKEENSEIKKYPDTKSGNFYSNCIRNFVQFVAILDLPDSNGRVVAETLGIQHGSHRVDFFACDVTNDEQVNGKIR